MTGDDRELNNRNVDDVIISMPDMRGYWSIALCPQGLLAIGSANDPLAHPLVTTEVTGRNMRAWPGMTPIAYGGMTGGFATVTSWRLGWPRPVWAAA
jgi:hypothetical protein